MRVSNMQSPRSGSPVANQYIINENGRETFQSYQTTIAYHDQTGFTISADWDYSNTTRKYFYEWLRGFGFNDFEIQTLAKMLRKAQAPTTIIELLGRRVSIKYVEEL